MRRSAPVLLAAALAVAVALVGRDGNAVAAGPPDQGPRRRPGSDRHPTSSCPAALQQLVDGVVEAGAPGAIALVRTGQATWRRPAASVTCAPSARHGVAIGSGSAA